MAGKHLVVAGFAALVLSIPMAADAKLQNASSQAVVFTAAGPAGLKIEGKSSDLTVNDDTNNVTVVVPLANLRTGIDLRDKHMREKYLEVQKFPNAELTVPRGGLKVPAEGSASGQAQGTMKIHGRTKNVTFHYTAKKNGSKVDVTGEARINMNDFGIEVPSYMGVTVKPDVSINVRFSAVDG